MNFTDPQLKKLIKEEYKKLIQESVALFKSILGAGLKKSGERLAKITTFEAAKDFFASKEFQKILVDALESSPQLATTISKLGKNTDISTLISKEASVIAPEVLEKVAPEFARKLRSDAFKKAQIAGMNRTAAEEAAKKEFNKAVINMFDDPKVRQNLTNSIGGVGKAGKAGADTVATKGTVAGSKTLDDAFEATGAGTGGAVDAFLKTSLKRAAAAGGILGGAALLWNSLTGGDIPVEETEAAVVTDPKKAIETIKKDPKVDVNTKKKAIQKVKKAVLTHKQRRTRVAAKTIGGAPKEAVKKFQDKLLALGYTLPKFGADGDYGSETVGAVKQFQASNGLKVDGFVGPNTWGAMTSEGAKGPGGVIDKAQEKSTSDDLGIRDLMNDPKRAARVYTYIQDQLRKESSSKKTFQVMPRIRKVQGGFVLKNTGYSANSTDFSAAAMGFLQALVNKKEDAAEVLGITPDKLMLIIKQGLAVPDDQKDDDSGSTIDPSVLTRGKQEPGLFAKDVTGPLAPFKLEEKSYNMDFDKWSKLWK